MGVCYHLMQVESNARKSFELFFCITLNLNFNSLMQFESIAENSAGVFCITFNMH